MLLDDHMPDVAPQNILVVDDEDHVCQLLAEALNYMGHKVRTAGDGQEAIQELEKGNFSIVITDIDMPRMDGMELIKYLTQTRNGIDVIAITGHSMKYKYTDVVNAGAADFIAKPFSVNELEAKLNRLVRERYLRQELEGLAVRDPLTGLYNRRFFQMVVRKEAVRAMRYKHPLFLLFFDIDSFKEYNDQRGHRAGDILLVQFAEILTSSIREHVDTAFRYGGDEFVVLLPHLEKEQAAMVGERIRKKLRDLNLAPTSLSVGIAQLMPDSGDIEEDIENMILRSDRALYRAKRTMGGNHVYCDGDATD